jgi:hypothetical protein
MDRLPAFRHVNPVDAAVEFIRAPFNPAIGLQPVNEAASCCFFNFQQVRQFHLARSGLNTEPPQHQPLGPRKSEPPYAPVKHRALHTRHIDD